MGNSSSIKTKVIAIMVALVVVCAVIFSQLALYSLNTVTDAQLKQADTQLTSNMVNTMNLNAERASQRVSALLSRSFEPVKALANVYAQSAAPNKSFSRDEVTSLVASTLESIDSASALYAQFENNGYDGKDADFKTAGGHSTPIGSLEVYFVKEDGKAVMYPVDDAQEKYLADRDENGIREAEWYLCSYDTHKSCVLDPYLYEIEEGNEQLMTTMTAPIMAGGRFRGLVGIDINLPILQQWINEYSQELFGGKAQLTLLSQRNLIAASSQFPEQLSKSLSSVDSKLEKALKDTSTLTKMDGYWYTRKTFPIADTDANWTLVIAIPESVALASIHEMQAFAEENYWQAVVTLLVLAGVFIAVAVFVALWIARSITQPIVQVSNSVQALASQEGDLTHKIKVSAHAELLALASGLNAFMEKLAVMIRVSKESASELVGELSQLTQSAQQLEGRTAKQQVELDNIATAVTEMSSTASEVANLASNTASNTMSCNNMLEGTRESLADNVKNVNKLAEDIQLSSQNVNEVAVKTDDITGILTTIQSIAEQTNLLALNAAIEAARAGDQGRGFAVVADEVRNLAARTHSSTEEIGQLIGELQSRVKLSVSTLDAIRDSVSSTVQQTQVSYDEISATLVSLDEINDSISQVATAAEQQSQVSEDISKRVVMVSDDSKDLAALGKVLKEVNLHIEGLIKTMDEQLARLRV